MKNEANAQKRKFNIFDFLLIVFFVGIIGGVIAVIVNAIPSSAISTGNVKVSYLISVSDVQEVVTEKLGVGQPIYDLDTGEKIGMITNVTQNPYVIKGVDQNGETVSNEVPGRLEINISVTADADYNGNKYLVNGTLIACGAELSFRTSDVALTGICISMKDG